MNRRRQVSLAIALLALMSPILSVAEDVPSAEKSKPKYHTELVRGKVVWMGDALKEHFGISTVPESTARTLAIYTEAGQLLPLAEDLRGRSFRKDERLRGKSMELFVRRYDDHPMLQVIRVYEFKNGKKYEVDYWCDICAIIMFETGSCACCQDDNRLRHRQVKAKSPGKTEK